MAQCDDQNFFTQSTNALWRPFTSRDAVPNIDSYIAAAPPTNQLVGGAMNLLGGSAKATAAANLVTQFNDLGLGADMIAGFSQQAIDFVKEQSPEASSKLMGVVSEYL
ncbi:MAG: hypothetical protein HON77_11045 [Gammaproteobacteria bacterium]|nr:hypothetical protein [Gammaproteobacteria bacterium]